MKTLTRISILLGVLFILALVSERSVELPQPSITLSSMSVVADSALPNADGADGSSNVPADLLPNSSLDPLPIPPTPVLVPTAPSPGIANPFDFNLREEKKAMRRERPVTPARPTPPPQPFSRNDLFIHMPPNASPLKPLRVLVVLHGMGGRGDIFSSGLIADADRHGWLLIAPTMRYRDYMDPVQLLQDDLLYTKMLYDTLDTLPAQLNVKIRQHILVLGFSRGAQLAQRFAMFYPERVATVAVISGGAYTLPAENRTQQNTTQTLMLPFGVGDLQQHLGKSVNWKEFKRITFWVAVGEKDNRKEDVARAFDSFEGLTRIERAKVLQQWLQAIGMDATIVIFPDTDHEITTFVRDTAIRFMRTDELSDNLND